MNKTINEISRKLIKSYQSKADKDIDDKFEAGITAIDKGDIKTGEKHIKKAEKRQDSYLLSSRKTLGTAKMTAKENIENDDDIETVTEQSHKIEAVYSDHGKKKKGILKVDANSKSSAKNKVGVYLSKSGYTVHSVNHVGMNEEVVIEEEETIEEGKSYKSDGSFSSKVKANMKKKEDNANKKRAADKRTVDEQ